MVKLNSIHNGKSFYEVNKTDYQLYEVTTDAICIYRTDKTQ